MRTAALFLSSALMALAAAPAGALPSNEICYSEAQAIATATLPDNSTLFTCPSAGVRTLPQLAAMGFRVVSLTPVAVGGGTSQRQQLVVKRGVEVHSDGFE